MLTLVHSCESDGSEEVEVKHARTGAAKKRRRKVVREEESEEEEEEEEFACKKCGKSTFFRVSHMKRHDCSNISSIQILYWVYCTARCRVRGSPRVDPAVRLV